MNLSTAEAVDFETVDFQEKAPNSEIKKVRQLLRQNRLQLPTPLKLSDFAYILSKVTRFINSHNRKIKEM